LKISKDIILRFAGWKRWKGGRRMKITVYDGAETIGGNKIYVEESGRGVFLDFGMNFAKYNQYFAEFLSERSTRGIHDLIHLNLIPRLNIYRKDLTPSDLDISAYPELDVRAVLLSHAHVDHCGNIALLDERIPIVTSPVSIAILKAMRDSGSSGIGSEIAYFTVREPAEDDRVLKSSSTKVPYRGRDFVCTGEVSDSLLSFLCYRPGQESKQARKLEPGEVCQADEYSLPFDIKVCEVDHSIYGASAYIIYGDTAVAYTGDIRVHGKHAEKSREFVKEAKNASVLIIEGTRASRGEDVNESEEIVFQKCLKAVEESDGLVIADFSPRNFERLDTFKEIAEKTGRQLVVTAKDAYMLHAMECVDGVCRMDDVGIYRELKEKKGKWEELVVEEKWGDAYVDPFEIRKNPDGYILCFSFYELKHLLDIKPNGGAYIYSSSEAFSEEQEFDFLRLYNWLNEFGFRVYGFEMVLDEGKLKPQFIRGYHASGHASKSDLRWMIEKIDPDVVIPVHTENPDWFVENFENVETLKEGERFEVK
jgi:ribonuclease J